MENNYTKTKLQFIEALGINSEEYDALFAKKGFKLSAGTLKNKVEYFMETFGLTKDQVARLFMKYNALMQTDVFSDEPNSMKNKIKLLNSLDFNNDEIINSPLVLTIPSNKIPIRYALCRVQGHDSNIFLKNSNFMYSEDKIYARYMYLNEQNKVLDKSVYASESKFVEKNKISTEYLLQKYRLSEDKKIQIMESLKQILSAEKMEKE